jgi:hypothetical protein
MPAEREVASTFRLPGAFCKNVFALEVCYANSATLCEFTGFAIPPNRAVAFVIGPLLAALGGYIYRLIIGPYDPRVDPGIN